MFITATITILIAIIINIIVGIIINNNVFWRSVIKVG